MYLNSIRTTSCSGIVCLNRFGLNPSKLFWQNQYNKVKSPYSILFPKQPDFQICQKRYHRFKPNTMSNSPMLFRQLFEKESSTYTYLLADKSDSTSILIDPVLETVERDAKLIQELGLTLKYVINTHMHADHITGTGELKKKFPNAKSIIGKKSGADVADIFLESGDKIEFGSRYLTAFNTPGHTEGCLTYVMDDHSCIFTGDTLLIRGCGRTDFQGGSSDMLYNSVRNILFGEKLNLSDDCIVYPAHDYNGRMCSSIGEEKKYNPRLKDGISVEEFSDIMANLNLAYPKKIDVSLPRNRLCGAFEIDNGGTK